MLVGLSPLPAAAVSVRSEREVLGATPLTVSPVNPARVELRTSQPEEHEKIREIFVLTPDADSDRFHLPRRTLCSSSKNAWVQNLKTCFDNHECGIARTYQSAKQGTHNDYPTTRIQGPKPTVLDHSPPFTTTNPLSQNNQSTSTQPRRMRNTYLNNTTSAPAENSSIVNLKWEAEKGQVNQLGNSATISVLCLLGVVFVLTGVVAYFLCRKRVAVESPKQHSKGCELIIPCETNPTDSLI
ncbi:C-X-C motif chemokine 16 [Dromiciops gliroides]|uniref:C-X-C motif chemokine 16 n=1 Tax=Dromiciops gliroides TaxID=33562 RepID=UPI001CC7FB5E|nr:C-X-C motif chemokine 16 [Dromiciops gliroides]